MMTKRHADERNVLRTVIPYLVDNFLIMKGARDELSYFRTSGLLLWMRWLS